MIRKAFVAGQFYPGDRESLRETIRKFADPAGFPEKAVAVVSPHARYMYSGAVAGAVFAATVIPATVVILGPGHRDIASLFAIQSRGTWQTPLGESPVETELAAKIIERSG